MLKKLQPKTQFNRNVLTLMTGTVIAQGIPIAISPLLTRIFTPEDFGVFALYMSIVSILAVIATGRYELAVILPEKDKEAANLVVISMIIVTFFCLLILIIVLLFNSQITTLLNTPRISSWLYFTPLSIFFIGLYQNLNFWVNRREKYKRQAIGKVVQNTAIGSASLGIGAGGLSSNGLITGLIFGQGVVASFFSYLTWKHDKTYFKEKKMDELLTIAKKYKDFPKYDILASLSSVSSQQITHILFNTLLNSTVAGYFYLAQRMLSAPITFLASAILDVFKQKAALQYKEHGNAKAIYISTFKKLLVLSVIPTAIIYYFSVDIFIFMFGDNWREAGVYAQILTPMLFFRFLANPLSFMLYIGEKQTINLYTQLGLFLSIVGAFYLSKSAKEIVILMSVFFSLFYITHLFVSAKIAGVFNKEIQV